MITATHHGIDGRVVTVTATRASGIARTLTIVGLRDAAEREARVRVESALVSARINVPSGTVVTCEARAPIDTLGVDLPIALAIASGAVGRVGAIGELSLAGELRPVRGVLPMIEALRDRVDFVIVPIESVAEAALVVGVRIAAARTLSDAIAYARGALKPAPPSTAAPPAASNVFPDMRDVRGVPEARRAMEIAAAGAHHVLLVGQPGAGKTMLARRLPGFLPPLSASEALEVTRIHSVAGLNVGGALVGTRPFRAPHHSTTPPGLVGGGGLARPGEVSLAHHGLLFMDELPEFTRASLEVLREPIAAGEAVLARTTGTLRFPSRATLVAATSPCPCGRFPDRRCRCNAEDRARYRSRVPARLDELFDVRVRLPPVDTDALEDDRIPEASSHIAARVLAARAVLAATKHTNSDALESAARARLARSVESELVPTVVVHRRVLRVARTIAALAGRDAIAERDVDEALALAVDGA